MQDIQGRLVVFCLFLDMLIMQEGRLEDSKKYFYQSYYMYTIMQDEDNVELAAKNLKDFFDIEVWN